MGREKEEKKRKERIEGRGKEQKKRKGKERTERRNVLLEIERE